MVRRQQKIKVLCVALRPVAMVVCPNALYSYFFSNINRSIDMVMRAYE